MTSNVSHFDKKFPSRRLEKDLKDVNLIDVVKNLERLAKNETWIVRMCVCAPEADKIKKWWQNLYTQMESSNGPVFCVPGLHCTSAIARSMTGRPFDSAFAGGMSPEELLKSAQSEAKHRCGNLKGKPVQITKVKGD